MSFGEAVVETTGDGATARPEISYQTADPSFAYASGSDVTLDGANQFASGVVATSSGLFVADGGNPAKAYAYNTDGTRNTGGDITLTGASSASGITATATHFYVVDSSSTVKAFTSAGAAASGNNFTGYSGAKGITAAPDGAFYTVNYISNATVVKAFNADRTKNTGGDFTPAGFSSGSTAPVGIAASRNRLYLLDASADKVLVYTRGGTRLTAEEFDLISANANPQGLAVASDGDLLVLDRYDRKIYRYDLTSSEAQYDIVASTATLASGDCQETGTGANDGKVYTCLYTVASGDSGAFRVMVGTETEDAAGNTLANQYRHGTTLTLDNTAPSKPSSLTLGTGLSALDNDSTPDIVVHIGETGGTVQLYTDSTCSTTGSGTVTVADTIPHPVSVTVTASEISSDGQVSYYAKHTDAVGNASACSTAKVDYTYDSTAPTITSAAFGTGTTTVAVTMSEDVYAATAPSAGDFKVKSGTSGSEAVNTVTGISGLSGTKAGAGTLITLTVTTTLATGNSVKVYYAQGTNRVTDEAGNELASLIEGSAVAATETALPTATLSGQPTGTNNTTTLAVNVGGTGVTHYRYGFAGGSACPAVGATDVTVLASTGFGAGVAVGERYVYLSSSAKALAYDKVSGARVSGADITFDSANTGTKGMHADGTYLYAVDDGDDKVFAYNLSTGSRDTSKEFDLSSGNDTAVAIVKTSTHFYVSDLDYTVYAYSAATGSADTSKNITTSSGVLGGTIKGMAVNGAYLYLMFNSHIRAYALSDGARAAGADINFYKNNVWGASDSVGGLTADGFGNFYVLRSKAGGDAMLHATYFSYGAEAAEGTNITDDISMLPDGAESLCVLGRVSAGLWQTTPTKASWTKDATVPTVSSVSASGTTLTVTMSENIYSATAPDGDNFTITGGGAPAVNSVTGIPTTAAGADDSFELTIASALSGGTPTLAYTQDGTDAKIPRDPAGNKLASFTGQSIAGPPAAPSALALGTGLDAVDNDSTPTVTVTVGQTGGTVTLYTDSSCSTAGSSAANVTDTTGTITVDVTATALTSDGAVSYYAKHTKGGASSACSTATVSYTYDSTAPTISSATFAAGTTVTVTMSEDVYAATAPTASDFKVKSGASGSEAANVVTTITGLESTKAGADNSFELTVTTALVTGNSVKVWYTKDSTKPVEDEAGNELASLAEANAVTATTGAVAPSAPSGLVLQSPSSSPGNDSTPVVRVTVGVTGGTVMLYTDSGCSTAGSSATGVSDAESPFTVDVTATALTTDGAVSYYAKHTKNNLSSACSTAKVDYTYDSAAPTVSSVVYSASDGGASVDSVVEGSAVYTKVVFSEKVGSVTGDGATARPAIKAKAQRNSSDTITEFQYDIIASGDLASGDCKETGTGANDGKVYSCMYTTPSDLTGYNTLKTYATAFSDEAGNAGTAETYAGVTDVVGVAQTPAGVSFTYADADGSTIDDTAIGYFNTGTQLYCTNTCGANDKLSGPGMLCNAGIGSVWEARIGGQSGTKHQAFYAVTPYTGGVHLFSGQFGNKPLPNGTVWYGLNGGKVWYKDSNNDNRCTAVPETGVTITVAYKLAMTLTGTLNTNSDIYSITAADADSGTTTWKKKLLTSSQSCNSTTMASGATDYTESDTIEITSGTGNNNKKMCFKVTDDESTPRTNYKAQTITGLTKAAMTMTVGSVPSGSAASKNISLTNIPTGATVKYNIITNATCNATNYGSGGSTLTVSSGSATLTVNNASDNNKYACIQLSKSGSTTRYFGSGQITGITSGKTLTISDVASDNRINATEDDSAVTISGSSTGLANNTTVTIAVDDADAGSVANHTFTATTNADGDWTTAATDLTADRVQAFVEGTITITVSATGATDATKTVEYDKTAPTVSYSVTTRGGVTDSSVDYLNAGDSVVVGMRLDEAAATAPTVQMMNGTANLGSAVTAGETSIFHSATLTGSDTAANDDPLDFGAVSASGVTRETLGSGYVYKTTKAFDSLYIGAYGTFDGGAAFRARTAGSKPTTSNLTTLGTELWSANAFGSSRGVYGGAIMTDVATGTYFWLYPSGSADRAMSNRDIVLLENVSEDFVLDHAASLSGSDSGSRTDPFDFGALSDVDGVTQETLGSGKIYKVTKPLRRLHISAGWTTGSSSDVVMRSATSKPTTTNLTTHGTQLWTASNSNVNTPTTASGVLTDVAEGSYFWVYIDSASSRTISARKFEVKGTEAVVADRHYVARYAVGSSDTVASGSLKYDVTNETSVTDAAGNSIAAKAATAISGTAIDTTAPAVLSAAASGSAIDITMAEKIWSGTAPDAANFVVTRSGGNAPSVSSVTGIPTTVATADSAFVLNLGAAAASGDTLALYAEQHGREDSARYRGEQDGGVHGDERDGGVGAERTYAEDAEQQPGE